MPKRTPESIKKQSENKVVEKLSDAQYEMDDGGLIFGELVDKTGFSSRTVSNILKTLRRAGVIDHKPVWRKTKRGTEGYTTLYYLTKAAGKAYPQFGVTRKHYEELANKVKPSLYEEPRPKDFISQVAQALTKDLIENWILARKARKELSIETLGQLMRDFGFMIEMYVYYRKPENAEALKTDPIKSVLKNRAKVDSQPSLYEEQFDELLKACGEEA